ncbi:hypothetical protein [Marinospirillum perlucidum]|uniref:hypothetical protein n=1 Tax=Marinospirillum perlucidum TaxID=1982602 RepID=UPI00138FC884|nr:hypothetical protein [Marinospirillum perlucidum]
MPLTRPTGLLCLVLLLLLASSSLTAASTPHPASFPPGLNALGSSGAVIADSTPAPCHPATSVCLASNHLSSCNLGLVLLPTLPTPVSVPITTAPSLAGTPGYINPFIPALTPPPQTLS